MSTNEAAMVAAHKKGRVAAAKTFVELTMDAQKEAPDSVDEQDSYIAGYTMELRRLAEYNKGRKP